MSCSVRPTNQPAQPHYSTQALLLVSCYKILMEHENKEEHAEITAITSQDEPRECSMEHERTRISLNISKVERAMQRTQHAIHKKRNSLKPDCFQRVPAHMPPHLKRAYERGKWTNRPIYLWNAVLANARRGHQLAKQANDAFTHVLHPDLSKPNVDMRIEHSKAIMNAVEANRKMRHQIRAALKSRNLKRASQQRELSKQYMNKRQLWNDIREKREREMSSTAQKSREQRDASLLFSMRPRPSGGSTNGANNLVEDATEIFNEIEEAGGTAGGLERWSRSITAIPDQNPNAISAPIDGGGVLLEDPLREHYSSRNVNPWTQQERLLFLDKFVIHGKNFRKIATFFEYKDVDEVVRFYYNNKLLFKLKVLGRDYVSKRRHVKKSTLVELSKLPTESRSIWDNFPNLKKRERDDDDDDTRRNQWKAIKRKRIGENGA